MQVKYGSYAFNADDVALSYMKKTMRSTTGIRTGFMEEWVLQFRLRGDTQSELTTEVNSLQSAFSVDGRDIVLLENGGGESAFVTNSSATTSGVRVNEVNFPILKDGQYTYFIDGTVRLNAETVTNVSADLFYSDSLTITGNGGPKRVVLETARGLPIVQTTRQRTKVTGVQSGTARAIGAVPSRPIIMFPGLLINESVSEGITTSLEGNKTVYTLSWTYPYQSSDYFSGTPQVRI